MQRLIILGASNALPTQDSESTHMVLAGAERMVMIDAPGGNPLLRLEQAGLDFNDLTDLVVTHFHMDHTLGIPLLLTNMWLMGRKRPLDIYGLAHTLDRVESLLDLYNWSEFPGFFPVTFHRVPPAEMSLVLDCADFVIHASPVRHVIPTLGLRAQLKESGRTIAYSCDTEPCDEVIRLGREADVLIHEAAGQLAGHSTAKQAGEIAQKAEAGSLYLIHYATGKQARGDLVAEARAAFSGEVALAKDLMTLV